MRGRYAEGVASLSPTIVPIHRDYLGNTHNQHLPQRGSIDTRAVDETPAG